MDTDKLAFEPCNAEMARVAGGGFIYCNSRKGHEGPHAHTYPAVTMPQPLTNAGETSGEFEPLLTDLTHARSCPSLTPLHEEDCTCGLIWRKRLHTEMEMHNAWRKRAEEAEASLGSMKETIEWVAGQQNLLFAECSQAEEIILRCKKALRREEHPNAESAGKS